MSLTLEQAANLSDTLSADERTEDKVKRVQAQLLELGLQIAQDEIKSHILGTSTREALDTLSKMGDGNPVAREVSGKLYATLFGNESQQSGISYGGTGSQHYSHTPARYLNRTELQATAAVAPQGMDGAAHLAAAYIGVHETGNNQGDAVRLFCGTEGVPWCGGFTHYVMQQTIPGVYTQGNFLMARSYMEEGDKYHAFHRDGAPQRGDVVVFDRGNGQGHVGIVSDVTPDGQVTYIAGNTADQVEASRFNWHNPPSDLLGHTSTRELAIAKGKGAELRIAEGDQPSAPMVAASQVSTHSKASFVRG